MVYASGRVSPLSPVGRRTLDRRGTPVRRFGSARPPGLGWTYQGGVCWSPVLRGERPRVSERSSTTGLTEAARRAWRDTGLPAGPCPAEETCRPSARRRGRWNRWRPTPHRLPQSAEGQWSFPNRPMSVLLPARPSGRAGFVLCVITKDRQPSPPPTGHRHTYARRTWLVMPRHQSRNRSTAPRLYRNRGDVRRGCLHGSGYKRDRRKVLRMFMSHERSFAIQLRQNASSQVGCVT